MPELRLVVLALQDKLAYGPTFESALAGLFGGGVSSMNAAAASAEPVHSAQSAQSAQAAAQPAADINGLISEASKDFADYQRLTSEGKLGEAGQKLEQLKRALEKLSARQK
jgi:hypothetical protein